MRNFPESNNPVCALHSSKYCRGKGATSEAGFARFLHIALGSASELEYHLTAAYDINALPEKDYRPLSSQVKEARMMLHGLRGSLKKD